MGNPIKRKKLRKMEAFKAAQLASVQKTEEVPTPANKEKPVPNALVFLEEQSNKEQDNTDKEQEEVRVTESVEPVNSNNSKELEKPSKKKKPLQEN